MGVEDHLESLEGDYTEGISFETIDISQDFSRAREYGVQATPTVLLIDNETGEVISGSVGAYDKAYYQKEIEKALQ